MDIFVQVLMHTPPAAQGVKLLNNQLLPARPLHLSYTQVHTAALVTADVEMFF